MNILPAQDLPKETSPTPITPGRVPSVPLWLWFWTLVPFFCLAPLYLGMDWYSNANNASTGEPGWPYSEPVLRLWIKWQYGTTIATLVSPFFWNIAIKRESAPLSFAMLTTIKKLYEFSWIALFLEIVIIAFLYLAVGMVGGAADVHVN